MIGTPSISTGVPAMPNTRTAPITISTIPTTVADQKMAFSARSRGIERRTRQTMNAASTQV